MSIPTIIKAPVQKQLEAFEPFFKKSIDSKIPLLSIITHYVIRRKGKQMRPLLVFLSAGLINKEANAQVGATLIELLHTATLIHDDVVDETYQRRGIFSINALWKSKIAVLVGDFFLSKGLIVALEHNQIEILKIVSEAVKEMSEGELLQIEKSRQLNITEEVYFEIIKKKTATLIAACTQAGAQSANASLEDIQKMRELGQNLGIAFQIKDDLFDYEKTNLIGKPTGNDIKEKKLTLPLIHVLAKISKGDRSKIIHTIKKHHKNEKKVAEIIEFVKQNGGIEYTVQKMNDYRDKSLQILNTFEKNAFRDSLEELIYFTTTRKS